MASPPRGGDEDFQLNDPVFVTRDSGNKLEGVVFFMGKVDFADGLDWVGVRLTGASVGQGKNDGSVKGKSYFDAPENSGLFVRKSNLRKRTMTRLEELRLRRELAGAGSVSSSGTTAATTASAAATPDRNTRIADSVAASSSSTPATGKMSKLEELRARREALKEKKSSTLGTPKPKSSATAEVSTPAAPAAAEASMSTPVPVAAISATASKTSAAVPVASAAPNEGGSIELQNQIRQLQLKIDQLTQDKENERIKTESVQSELQQATEKIAKLEERSKLAERASLSDSLEEEFNQIQHAKEEAQEKLQDSQSEIKRLQNSLGQEREAHAVHLNELTLARTQATTWQKEYQAIRDQSQSKSGTEAANYKERARFQAEVAAHQREKDTWQKEKLDLEAALEEVTLDKEQLLEEKESLEDKLEELKLDADTASMEVEELKMELEDARQASEAAEAGGGGEDDTAEEKMRALSVQNARLREALIRLREQTSMEKLEQNKVIRHAEKEVEEAKSLKSEVENLRSVKASFEEQINDLKDMVEQGAAFEGMVEDLSDRVLSLEEDNIALQTTIREMEEGTELQAEVEEVQADELKALTRDLEGRDAIIHNLEEAIKMQRRREEDFRRTVGNYRTTVELLKQEKQALLELQQGGEANKTQVIASSQKALARAAQLVSDAAEMRKREAQYTFDGIDLQVYKHLSHRLEEMLPPTLVAAELTAMKGELITSKVVSIASRSLEGIVQSFGKVIKPALPVDHVQSAAGATEDLNLSDDAKQEVSTMLHQVECGHVLVDVSADLRRLLAAGQWPDLLTSEVSIELGSILGHAVQDLDSRIGVVLKYLKEEGVLSPEQSSIDSLKQGIQATMQRLQADIEREDAVLVPPNWRPPGWQLFKDASTSRFSCLGAAAALSSVLNQPEYADEPPVAMVALYNRLEQASSQASNVCLRLTNLEVQNNQLVNELTESASLLKMESSDLMKSVQEFLFASGGNVALCEASVSKTLKVLAKVLATLRAAQLNPSENADVFHALSPEDKDCWKRLTDLVRNIRAVDGDPEDVNHIARVREMERHLEEAIANEPKLEQAEAKVSQLEKTLSSRSKEIAMTNARLSELENQLAKTSGIRSSRVHSADVKSAEEFNNLKEENRVLTEAMDVLQKQVDEYENEIRSLKDFKTPKRGAAARGTPRRALTSITDLTSPGRSVATEEPLTSTGSLEATIFRPALQNALRDAARWKSIAVGNVLSELPPLPNTFSVSPIGAKKETARGDLQQLNSAMSNYRMQMASVKLIDLTNPHKSPRQQLRESKARSRMATENLQFVVNRCREHVYGQ